MSIGALGNSGIPQSQGDVLASLYREAAAKLRQIVLNPTGRTAGSAAFNGARAAQQVHQVQGLIQQLKASAANWIGDARDGSSGPVTEAVKAGVALANKQAAAIGIHSKGPISARGSFSLIDRGTVELFAREIAIDLNKAANSMGATAEKALRTTQQLKLGEADINRILANGVIEGKPQAAINQLRDDLEAVHGEKVIVTDKNGDPIEFSPAYYAKMVVHTQTRAATVHARHARLQDLGLDLVAIIGRLSKNFCTAFLGMVFSLSGKSSKYPAYSSLPGGGPPFHPNCSKGTRPFVDDAATKDELEDADGVDDADHLLGQNTTQAQRTFKDLQIYEQVKANYPKQSAVMVAPKKKH